VTLPHPEAVFVRQDAWQLGPPAQPWDPYSLAYARAVREMQSRPADDPTSWAFQGAIHGTRDPDPRPEFNMCQHFSWFFLPWHRMYIACFEQIVRAIAVAQGGPADWALPFWNWSVNRALPPAFREATLPDGSPNPLRVEARNAGIDQGAQLPAATVAADYALGFAGFVSPRESARGAWDTGFGGGPEEPDVHFGSTPGALEDWPHNHLHVLIGGADGLMTDPDTAALDPIFWLHHANVDRVWEQWRGLGGTRTNPPEAEWRDQAYGFFDAGGQPVSGLVSECLDPAALGYRYSYPLPVATSRDATTAPGLTAAAGAPTPAREDVPVVELGAIEGVELVGGTVTAPVALSPAADDTVTLLSGSPAEAPPLHLNLEGLEMDRDPGIVWAVYLNLPGEDAASPRSGAHLVGYLSLFGVSHAGHHAGGVARTYDIRSLAKQLSDAGLWDPARLTVTFVPTGLEAPEGGELLSAAPPVAPPDRPVRIRRISLTSE
jgi:hypothetical protein